MSIYKNALLLARYWSVPVRCRYSRESPVAACFEALLSGMFKLTNKALPSYVFCCLISAEALFPQHVAAEAVQRPSCRLGLLLATWCSDEVGRMCSQVEAAVSGWVRYPGVGGIPCPSNVLKLGCRLLP